MKGLGRLLVVHPHLSVVGGSEELTRMLVEELSRIGVKVGVLTGSPGPVKGASRVWVVRRRLGDGALARMAEVLLAFGEALEAFEPDAVLVMIHEPLYAVMAKMVRPGTPVGIYIHFPVEEEVHEGNLEDFYELYRFPVFEPKMYLVPDVHMANSMYTARALYKMFGVEANVVYPCIAREYLEEEPDLESPREPLVVTVGRLVPHKNHKLVLKAFAEVRERVPGARLVVAGPVDPRYSDYFEELRKAVEGTPGAELLVEPPRSELIKLYREARVYVHARVGEHFGMAPLEALSQGALVVAHESTGLAELLGPEEGLFLYREPGELSRALFKALTTPEREVVGMRRRARARAMYFSPERFAREVLGYLSSAVEARERLSPLLRLSRG